MFKLLLGIALGVAGTMYYSDSVRLKVKDTNREIRDLLYNKIEFKREVYKEIQRMQATGELDDILYHRIPLYRNRQDIAIQDERNDL